MSRACDAQNSWVESLEQRCMLSAAPALSLKPLALATPTIEVERDNGGEFITNGTITPLDLKFGILGLSTPDKNSFDQIAIFNDESVPLTISNASVPAGFISNLSTLSVLPPSSDGSSKSFQISLDTSTAGDKSGTLSFKVSAAGFAPLTFSFPLHGVVVGSTPLATLTFNNTQFVDPGTGKPAVGFLSFIPIIDSSAHEILSPGNAIYLLHLPFALNNVQLGFNATLDGNIGNSGLSFYADTNGNKRLDLAEKNKLLTSATINDPDGGTVTKNVSASSNGMAAGDYFVEINSLTTDFGNSTAFTTDYTITASATSAGAPALSVTAADGVSAPSGAFGTVNTNAAASKTFTVKNSGTSTLHFSNTPSVTVPAGFTLTTDLPPSLTAGKTATFTVALNTSTTGSKSGTLQITSDAGSPFTLALSGTVGAPSSTTGTVAGVVFNDKNGNGAKEKKDTVLAGIKLTLQPTKKGKAVGRAATAVSDSKGNYVFSKVAAASYKLTEAPPPGNGITTPVAGSYSFALTGGQSLTSENFGNLKGFKPAAAVRVTSPFLVASAIPAAAGAGGTGLSTASIPIRSIPIPPIRPPALPMAQVHVTDDRINRDVPNGLSRTVELHFGILGQNGSANNSFDGLTITSFSNVPLTISNVSVPAGFTTDLPGSSLLPAPSPFASSEAFRIALDTSTEGDKSGIFSFTATGPGVLPLDYSFPLHGTVVGGTPVATLAFSNGRFVDPGTGKPATASLEFRPQTDNSAHEILSPGNAVYRLHLPYALNNVQLGLNAILSGVAGNAGLYFYRDANGNGKLDLAEKNQPLASIQLTAPGGATPAQNGTASPSSGAQAGGDYFVEINTLATDFDLDPLTTQFTLTASATDAGTPVIAVTAADGASAANGDFGSAIKGATQTRTFTVKNTGTSPLHFSNTPSVTVPAGFILVGDLPASLAVGQSAQFTVAIDTTTAGAKSGTLQIASDANGSPYTLAISGTVAAPAATPKPTPPAGPVPTTSTIAGIVFNDKNGNGVKEKKETPLAGITITLQKIKKGKVIGGAATSKTNSRGHYAFSNIAAASYKLTETAPSGNGITTPVSGSYSFGLASGQSLTNENFGNLKGFKPKAATPFLATIVPHSKPLEADATLLLFSGKNPRGVFAI